MLPPPGGAQPNGGQSVVENEGKQRSGNGGRPGSVRVGATIGSLINQLDENDQMARLALQAGFNRWEHLRQGGLQRVADGGGLTAPAGARTLAAALLAAYQGGMLLADVSGDVAPLRRALRGVTGVALVPATPTRAGKPETVASPGGVRYGTVSESPPGAAQLSRQESSQVSIGCG